MTVKECYEKMGGDYDEVFRRLRTDERIAKFLLRIPGDESFELLKKSLAAHNIAEAFRAAHTIKGICLNLSVTTLFKSSNALTEALRDRKDYGSDIDELAEAVKADYDVVAAAISELAAGQQ